MTAHTTQNRRRALRAATSITAGVVTLATLSGCMLLPKPGGGDAAGGGVKFDDVQSATIQLEAHGTFVSPEEGAFEGGGRGSGFIIDPSGLAITNNHVVVGAGTLSVWRGGDTDEKLNAKVLGASECLDLALVQLPKGDYPYFDWREGKIPTATEVYAAGFPLGDPEFTMTKGIVSKADIHAETQWASVDHVIEHDAKIRPGNSGGPLVDTDGRLVGVNYAGDTTYDYNFAIHRDEVQANIEALKEGDVLSLGINAQGLRDEEGNGLGIWVESIASGSPADEAGIKPGDLLTRMEGVSLGQSGTLEEYCDVLTTKGDDAVLAVELYRPDENAYYEGKINGDEDITPVQTLTEGEVDGDVQTVTDDSQSLQIQIPSSWTDIDGAPFKDPTGQEWASIVGTPNADGFHGGWDTPGTQVVMLPTSNLKDAQPVLDLYTKLVKSGGCEAAGGDEYSDAAHTGVYELFSNCGPEGAGYIIVTLQATDSSYVAVVGVQANSEDDLAVVDLVLGSLRVAA